MYFSFYSKKDNRLEKVELVLTNSGWYMQHDCYSGLISPEGLPHLQDCIHSNYSEYPPALGDAFSEIWQAATYQNLSQREVQARLDAFSEWVQHYSKTKSSKPIQC